MTAVYRVTVRGRFSGLTDRQRSALHSAATEHDLFLSSFSEEGSLTYGSTVDFFSFRREIRLPSGGSEETACAEAIDSAGEFLRVLGYGYKDLKARAMDMSAMSERARHSGQ